ncbi:MAG: response regulator [Nitrospirae bacterium]|nr:response regulator [Nitrospirota bacterium]
MNNMSGNKKCILIVDDEPGNRQLLMQILVDSYNLSFACDGESALEAARNVKPDIILLDILMPGLDGYQTCHNLKDDAETAAIPIIFISVLTDISEKVTAFDCGGVDYITKPFKREEVMARVGIHLKLYDLQKSLEEKNLRLQQTQDELLTLNSNLENRVAEEIKKRRRNEQILIQQSKMAAMGEMIGAIAHQWKQPLHALALMVQDTELAFEAGELNMDYIGDSVNKSMGLIQLMANTADDFRNFLKPSTQKTVFDVSAAFHDVLNLFSEQFNSILIQLNAPKTHNLLSAGYLNEFKQVILNLLSNSRDAIAAKGHREGYISIDIEEGQGNVIVQVRDNGGGIAEPVMDKLFEAYVTTKGDAGTGIGLYMSRAIIEEKMAGKIYATNIMGGAEFTVELPLYESIAPA